MSFNTKDIVAIDLNKSREMGNFVVELADELTKRALSENEFTIDPFFDRAPIYESFVDVIKDICEAYPVILRVNNFRPALNDHRFHCDTGRTKNLPLFINLDDIENHVNECFRDNTYPDKDPTPWGRRGLSEPWNSLAKSAECNCICKTAYRYLDYFFDDVIASVSDEFTTREEYEEIGLYFVPEDERDFYAIDLSKDKSTAEMLALKFEKRLSSMGYIFPQTETIAFCALTNIYNYDLDCLQITTAFKDYLEIVLPRKGIAVSSPRSVLRVIEKEERELQSFLVSELKNEKPELFIFTNKRKNQ